MVTAAIWFFQSNKTDNNIFFYRIYSLELLICSIRNELGVHQIIIKCQIASFIEYNQASVRLHLWKCCNVIGEKFNNKKSGENYVQSKYRIYER